MQEPGDNRVLTIGAQIPGPEAHDGMHRIFKHPIRRLKGASDRGGFSTDQVCHATPQCLLGFGCEAEGHFPGRFRRVPHWKRSF